MTLTTDRVLVGLAAAAGVLVVIGVVAYALLMGEGRLPLPFTIHNDTDATVAIWIEHGGAEFQPEHDDISPRLNPGEVGVYGLDSEYASIEYANSCTDGDIIARYDDGSEVRIAPPVCTNELVEIADWVTSLYVTNDTHRTYQLWVEHDGELLVPRGGDQDVEVGATARFAIRGRYALPVADGPVCIDGDLVAKHGGLPDIRIPAPICDGDSITLSEFAGP